MNLQEAIEEAGYGTRSYSGRGMYGKECLGVCIDDNVGNIVATLVVETIFTAIDASGESDSEVYDIGQLLKGAKTDSLGRGTIVYFPDVPYISDAEALNEDDYAEGSSIADDTGCDV